MGKTKAKKPTRDQKELMKKAGLIPKNWLVLDDHETLLHCVSRGNGISRYIRKGHQ